MKANDENLLDLMFDAKRQYQIPVYQRNYDWSKDSCLQLFNDIVDAYKEENKHFLGSIVQVQLGEEDGINKYIIIDGQQRTTTIYLLLKALYDSSKDNEDLHEQLEDLLFNKKSNKVLTNEDKNKLKLKPIKSDNIELKCLMNDELDKMDKSSNVWINYNYFMQLVAKEKKEEITQKNILKGLRYLRIVMITLSEPEDNPQIIFERINSTGEDLTLADLVRNYLLMTDLDRENLFENYWVPLESLFKENPKTDLNNFFETYVLFKLPDYSGKDSYHQFKKYCDKNSIKHKDLLIEMLRLGRYYHFFIYGGNEYPSVICSILKGFASLKQTTIFPFLFSIFDDYTNNYIDIETLSETLLFFLNYTLRRSITGVPTNSLRGLYKGLYKRIFNDVNKKKDYLNSIYDFMASIPSTSDIVPNDTKVTESLISNNLYKNRPSCKLILNIIENGFYRKKEFVSIDNQITIEHIMPQNHDNVWWQKEIGNDFEMIYTKYLHTIGNLTLTGYNSELSDKTFPEKKLLLKQTKFTELDEDILDKEHWSKENIENRARNLSSILINELKLPSNFNKKNILLDETKHRIDEAMDYSHQTPTSFTLQGTNQDVSSAKDFLIKVLALLNQFNSELLPSLAKENFKFDDATKPLITYDKNLLRAPAEIENTGIYVETNRSTNDTIKLIRKFLDIFGIDYDDFVFTMSVSKVNNGTNS